MSAIQPGQTIGNYRILQQIGTGGMGAVYLAEHPLIGKKVALKVIHRELAHNREVVGRFFNEARAVNKIGNEHIVEVHDFGQSPDGYYFFLMEYLEGRTLAQVLAAEKVLSIPRALHIGAQIADALGAAHTAGIIHRDLKPDNVMLMMRLGDPDFVKILDFGLAKMFQDGMASNLTAQGVVLGTPQYMSPEACESKRDIDHRTDIYACGILLYQMLCGQVPFDGESMGEVLVKQVMHAPPAPRATNPTVPPSLEQIILRCLAKAPDARFPTMAALRDALLDPDRYLASSPPVVPAALTRSSPAARTLFVDDAGPQLAAMQQQAQPQSGRASDLALKPPPPSMMGGAPVAADAKTMFLQGQGQVIGGVPVTAMPPDQMDAAIAGMRRSTAMPGMAMPAQPINQTMVIGTPAGYKDRPPRKAWPIVLVIVLIAAAAGGGIAVAMMLRGGGNAAKAAPDAEPTVEAPVAVAAVDAGAAPVAVAAVDAGAVAVVAADAGAAAAPVADAGAVAVAAPDAGAVRVAAVDAGTTVVPLAIAVDAGVASVQPILATVHIETTPPGAEVIIDGKSYGKTPIAIDLPPDNADHELVLRHPQAKEKKKTFQITGPMTLKLELERVSTSKGTGKGKGKGKGKGTDSGDNGDDLMKPPWEK